MDSTFKEVSNISTKGMTRDLSFDVLKGILILIVVFGHALQFQYQEDCWSHPLFDGIYTFHMPLFVFVSGYFFSSCTKRNFQDMLSSKVKRLMLPWFIWTCVLISALLVIRGEAFLHLPVAEQGSILYQEMQTYWYLICVFVLTLFYYLIFRKELYKSQLARIIVVIALMVLWGFSLAYFDDLPWFCLKYCQITRQTLVFGLGIMYFRYKDKLGGAVYVILLLAIIGAVYDRMEWDRWIVDYTLTQRIIDGIYCTIIAFVILKVISGYLSKMRISQALSYFGKNSLGIYLIHIAFFHPMMNNDLVFSCHTVFSAFILFVVYLAISVLIVESIKHLLKEKSYILGV